MVVAGCNCDRGCRGGAEREVERLRARVLSKQKLLHPICLMVVLTDIFLPARLIEEGTDTPLSPTSSSPFQFLQFERF